MRHLAGRKLSSLFTARLIRAAALHGVPVAGLWRCIGGQIVGDDFPMIQEHQHLAVWERVMARVGDSGFPIRYADTVTIDDYGVLGLAAKTASDLGASLSVIERHLPSYHEAISVAIERSHAHPTVVVRGDSTGRLHARAVIGVRCATESALAELLGGIRAVIGRRLIPTRVTFVHAAPRELAAHVAHFGVRPRFDAERNTIVLPAGALALATVRADRALFEFLEGRLVALAAARMAQPGLSWRERVHAEIIHELPRSPRIASVARTLAISTRTLQRHLRDEATTFDDILDSSRRDLAAILLEDRARSVYDVAISLGFADVSSFARAHRRWHGHPPRRR